MHRGSSCSQKNSLRDVAFFFILNLSEAKGGIGSRIAAGVGRKVVAIVITGLFGCKPDAAAA